MAEYIKRQKAIDLFYPVDPENDGSDGTTLVCQSLNYSSADVEFMLSDMPAEDVAPVRHGRWNRPYISWFLPMKIKNPHCFCTNCAYPMKHKKVTRYCPNCGAKMDLEVPENETL